MATIEKLLTAEELQQMAEPEDGRRLELFQGEPIPITPAGARHGQCCGLVARNLIEYSKSQGVGHVVSNDTGIVVEKDPDTVLAPDVAYWSRRRLPQLPEGFVEIMPDLVVEVISPNDSQSYVHRKVLQYLDHGVALIWIVDPKTRTVTEYRSRREVRILSETEPISGGDALPGFECRVGEFFEE